MREPSAEVRVVRNTIEEPAGTDIEREYEGRETNERVKAEDLKEKEKESPDGTGMRFGSRHAQSH